MVEDMSSDASIRHTGSIPVLIPTQLSALVLAMMQPIHIKPTWMIHIPVSLSISLSNSLFLLSVTFIQSQCSWPHVASYKNGPTLFHTLRYTYFKFGEERALELDQYSVSAEILSLGFGIAIERVYRKGWISVSLLFLSTAVIVLPI